MKPVMYILLLIMLLTGTAPVQSAGKMLHDSPQMAEQMSMHGEHMAGQAHDCCQPGEADDACAADPDRCGHACADCSMASSAAVGQPFDWQEPRSLWHVGQHTFLMSHTFSTPLQRPPISA